MRLGIRHVQTFLIFLCFVINFMSRLNVSFALVAMTNAKSTNPDYPEYKWNEKQISYIISSANVGLTLSAIPGSLMCRKLGTKTTMAVSMMGASVLSLLTPSSIPLGGWKIYCGIRLIQGLFQGLFFPCYSHHLAIWTPPDEVTRLGALSYNGISVGTILAMLTSGFIAKSSWGWPGISYFAGVLGMIWCLIWQIVGDNTPATSRFISSEERNFIMESQKKGDGTQHKIPIPWKAIVTSRPFISLIVVNIAGYWGYTTILFEIPLYMQGVLQMDIRSNAISSSLPYVAVFVMSIVYLFLFDVLIKNKVMSVRTSKQIINTVAMWIPAVALIYVGFLDQNQKELAVLLMVIIVGVNAGVTVGNGMNGIELSPNHAGILGAFTSSFKCFASILTPLLVGIVVNNQTDRSQWQIIFMIAGVIFFIGNLLYIFFGSNIRQPWDADDFHMSNKETEGRTTCVADGGVLKSELNVLIENVNVSGKKFAQILK